MLRWLGRLPIVLFLLAFPIAFSQPMACFGLAKAITLPEVPYGLSAWDWQAFIHRHTLNGFSSVAAEVNADTAAPLQIFESVEGTAKHPIGVCCDGCSVVVVVLKQKTPVPGNIQFTLAGPPGGFPATGSLSTAFPNIPAPQTATTNDESTVTVASTSYTVLFYRPPASYLNATSSGAEPSNGWPPVTIIATSSTGAVLGTINLTLRPPPVLLVHGFNSGPGTWDYPPPANAPADQGAHPYFHSLNPTNEAIGVADYSAQNTSGLATVMPIVLDNLRSLVADSRDSQIEDTQADAVCHSYGGLICKCLAENAKALTVQRPAGFPQFVWSAQLDGEYLRYDNDELGYFRRVVTIGSVLDGSPVASYLIGYLAAQYGAGGYIAARQVELLGGLSGDCDALSDLATQNAVIQALAAKPAVEWRPIVCTMAPQNQQQLNNDLLTKYVIVYLFFNHYGLNIANLGLTPAGSDGVVTVGSQTDSGYANSVNPKVAVGNLFHTDEPGCQAVFDDAADLLELDIAPNGPSGSYTMFKPSFLGKWGRK